MQTELGGDLHFDAVQSISRLVIRGTARLARYVFVACRV